MIQKIFFTIYWLINLAGAIYILNAKVILEDQAKIYLFASILLLQFIYYFLIIKALMKADMDKKIKQHYLLLFFVFPPFQIYFIWWKL